MTVTECEKKIKKLVDIFKDDISQKCDSTPIVTLHIRDQTCSEANFTIACDNLDLAVEYDVKKDVNIDVSGIKCRLDAETPEFKTEDIGGVLLNVPKKSEIRCEQDPIINLDTKTSESLKKREQQIKTNCEFWIQYDKDMDLNIAKVNKPVGSESIAKNIGCCNRLSNNSLIIDDPDWRNRIC